MLAFALDQRRHSRVYFSLAIAAAASIWPRTRQRIGLYQRTDPACACDTFNQHSRPMAMFLSAKIMGARRREFIRAPTSDDLFYTT